MMLTISLSCFQELSIRQFSSTELRINPGLKVLPLLTFFEFQYSCLGFGLLERPSTFATDLRAAVAAAGDRAAAAFGIELLGPNQVGIHSSRVITDFTDLQSFAMN